MFVPELRSLTIGWSLTIALAHHLRSKWRANPPLTLRTRSQLIRIDGADAPRHAIGAAACHPLSTRRFAPAIQRLQRSVVHASKLAHPPAADPQPRSAHRRLGMSKMLKADTNFSPCPVREGDELFPNGIFEFNVTRILEHISNDPAEVDLEEIAVDDFEPEFSVLDQSHVDSVDISRPVVLVEISPGIYNLIDGHHRMAKARRLGIEKMRAYKLNVHQHIAFLTSKKAYLSYVEYRNGKLKAEQERCTASR